MKKILLFAVIVIVSFSSYSQSYSHIKELETKAKEGDAQALYELGNFCYEEDILAMKALGFNTLRKHIKVEPMRYYYLCDKLGILVIQDMPSGDGSKLFNFSHANFAYGSVRREWKNVMDNLAVRRYPSPEAFCIDVNNDGKQTVDEFFHRFTSHVSVSAILARNAENVLAERSKARRALSVKS